MDADAQAVRDRQPVTVVDDEDATFTVPRLLLAGARGPGRTGTMTWELCYGGVPIASGSLDQDDDVSFTDVAAVQPGMDSGGFTVTARYEDGRCLPLGAICVRPGRPPTRAEATARAQWPGARDQPEAPSLRRPFLDGIREAVRPGSGSRPPARRRVCVYQHFAALLAGRRRRLRERPHQLSPDRAG